MTHLRRALSRRAFLRGAAGIATAVAAPALIRRPASAAVGPDAVVDARTASTYHVGVL